MRPGGSKQAVCDEKRRLLEAYDAATQAYVRAMGELRERMGTVPKTAYNELFQATETARAASEAARAALLAHIREHNC